MADTDILYVEDDFVAAGYVEVIRVTSALLSPYIDDQEAYVDIDYVRNQSGEFTLLADTSGVQHEADANLNVIADLFPQTIGGVISPTDAGLSSFVIIGAIPSVVAGTSSTIASQATVTADVGKILDAQTDLDAIATQVSAAAKVGGTLADLQSQFLTFPQPQATRVAGASADINSFAISSNNQPIKIPPDSTFERALAADLDTLTYSSNSKVGSYSAEMQGENLYAEYFIDENQYPQRTVDWFLQTELRLEPSSQQPSNPRYDFIKIGADYGAGIGFGDTLAIELYQQGTRLYLSVRNNGSTTTASTTDIVASNSWSSIAITYEHSSANQGNFDVYIEGNRAITINSVELPAFVDKNTAETRLILGGGQNIIHHSENPGIFRQDELRIVQGLNVVNDYAVRFSSVNNNESPSFLANGWSDTPETGILLHFEQSSDDVGSVGFAATLSDFFTLSAAATKLIFADATLNSAFAVTADVGSIETVSATLASDFQTQSTATKISQSSSDLSSAFAVTALAQVNKLFDSQLSALATTQVTASSTLVAVGDLDAIATTLTAAAKVGDTLADATVNTTLTALGGLEKATGADINSQATVSATALVVADADSAVTATTTASATGLRTRSTPADLAVSAEIQADVGVVERSSADLASASTVDTVGGIIYSLESLQSASTAITADFTRTLALDSAILSEFTLASTANTAKLFDATVTASASTQITGGVIKPAVSDLDAIATTLSAAAKVGDYLVDATVNSTVEALAVKFVGDVPVEIGATTAITADVTRTRPGTSTIDVITTATATPIVVFEVDASITGNFAITVDATETQGFAAQIDSAFATSATAELTKGFSVDIESALDFAVTAGEIEPAGADLSTSINITATGGLVAEGTADLAGAFSAQGTITIIKIDQYVYVIPAESRTHSLTAESRSHTVTFENREYNLEE